MIVMDEERREIKNIRPELQESLKKMAEEKLERKRLIYLGKSKSFRDYIVRRLHVIMRDYLESKGVIKWELLRYYNFYTWCMARILDYGAEYIDEVFDMAEEKFIEKNGLDSEIVKEIEIKIIEYLRNLSSLYHEYQKVKAKYEEEMKKQRS